MNPLKCMLIGDQCVGKSALLEQLMTKQFLGMSESTIGIEFGSISINYNNYDIPLQIWDTAGQEVFRSIIQSYYNSSAIIMLVYDITKRNTFDNLSYWVNQIRSHKILVLVGNKNDLENRRRVTYEEGQTFALNNGFLFFETSAKTGFNVDKSFQQGVIEACHSDLYELHPIIKLQSIKLNDTPSEIMIKKNGGGDDNLRQCCCIIL